MWPRYWFHKPWGRGSLNQPRPSCFTADATFFYVPSIALRPLPKRKEEQSYFNFIDRRPRLDHKCPTLTRPDEWWELWPRRTVREGSAVKTNRDFIAAPAKRPFSFLTVVHVIYCRCDRRRRPPLEWFIATRFSDVLWFDVKVAPGNRKRGFKHKNKNQRRRKSGFFFFQVYKCCVSGRRPRERCQLLILHTAASEKSGRSWSRGRLVLPYGCMEGDMWRPQAQLTLRDVTSGRGCRTHTRGSLWSSLIRKIWRIEMHGDK